MECYVYALVDPINRQPFYIGKGKKRRAWAHFEPGQKCNKKKINYIKNIRNLGFEPVVYKIYENLSSDEALKVEKRLIDKWKTVLTNMNNPPPDRAGSRLSEKHIQKLKEFNSGKTSMDRYHGARRYSKNY